MRALLRALAVCAVTVAAGGAPAQVLDFEALDGWTDDDHLEALAVFRQTCDLLKDPEWKPLCKVAAEADGSPEAAREFFEIFFKPVQVGDPPALFTGYYEPELEGSPFRTPRFAWPIYARPPELPDGTPWLTRSEIDSGLLSGRGLEIAWLDDPVEVFFLQVQGSGRIRMPDGRVLRVGFAGKNGHPYVSVGKEMVRRGLLRIEEASAQAIRAWVRMNPAQGQALLSLNPSYVFFRKLPSLAADKGPIGAMGRSITTLRSIAVDPLFTPLGAPVWVEKDGYRPLRRLFVAQDTGGAIKGMQRADIFYGTGHRAGEVAGEVKDGGRMMVLLPIDLAFATLPEN
ncbi:murein transglycosylase A [Cereibacter sphaeroides]|uniref:murein transglycosylase A n=1 Tax=Cereibacter sphaeroides TaxID=1063 RepID=UPI001F2F2D8D|nr:murein transglycosylase A [Cereibacter sphaeroides]MCE6961010.1 murein transglycosylase A [Cereibacter sphaeroides]MCE6969692.1 murein transglycosylase A [Cereibacter sphaeroides]MCE6975167.1 murein transglycosylase A [Cereibacter sphaeroides]